MVLIPQNLSWALINLANETVQIDIDLKNIEDFYQSAIVRLSYLYPSLNFDFKDNKVIISNINQSNSIQDLKKSVKYIFYKEKIYFDNKDLRKKIYESFGWCYYLGNSMKSIKIILLQMKLALFFTVIKGH